jgi:hypothetical protein
MLKIIAALSIILSAAPVFAQSTYVRGYTKQIGTYVEPHYRSHEDSTVQNNWSHQGNVNPYTGREGHRNDNDSQKVNPYGQAEC